MTDDNARYCPRCGNVLFTDEQGDFCISCDSGRRKAKDEPAKRNNCPHGPDGEVRHLFALGGGACLCGAEYRIPIAGPFRSRPKE